MTEMLRNSQEKFKIGAEQSYKNLTMFPLLSGFSTQHNYLAMNESLPNDIIDENGMDKNRSHTKHGINNKPIHIVSSLDRESPARLDPSLSVSDTALTFEKAAALIPGTSTEKHRALGKPNRDDGDRCFASSWDYIEQFARVDSQIGAIFLINGKIVSLICFDSPETFEKSFINIVECYAMKAVDEFSPKIVPKSLKPEVINFLRPPNNA